ncbi:hypothetical protein [Lactococcus garvieae]|uniref:hypothetical protein n=1 Tax=Lactococcus garvieae TaxID=1363 RepID=UPI00254CCF4F|nr:hypothetical protein [Lactococcus garvieae]
MLTTIVAAIAGLCSSIILLILKYLFEQYLIRTKAFSESTSDILMLKILAPFQKSIEFNLYKIIVISSNHPLKKNEVLISDILPNLRKLYYKIESDYELFSHISETLFYSLKQLLETIEQSPNDTKEINKIYLLFSSNYFIMLNKVRKGKFLPNRKEDFRKSLSLYQNENLKSFEKKHAKNKIISYLIFVLIGIPALMLLIVSVAHLLVSFYELTLMLYNI